MSHREKVGGDSHRIDSFSSLGGMLLMKMGLLADLQHMHYWARPIQDER
jgi:hypothetical protein